VGPVTGYALPRFVSVRVDQANLRTGPDRYFPIRTVLTRRATERETAALTAGLEDLRARFAEDPERAGQLLMQGASAPAEAWAPEELAAWTLLASSVLNLFEATHPR